MSFVLHGDVDPVAVPDELQGGQRRVDVNFAADDVDGRLAQSAAAREGQRPPARVCGPKPPGGAAQSRSPVRGHSIGFARTSRPLSSPKNGSGSRKGAPLGFVCGALDKIAESVLGPES